MSALAKIIRTKLLPWSMQNGRERFIITRPQMHQRDMPADVSLHSRSIKGKRVAVRGRRIYKNSRHITARWPESGLIEVQKYKLMCVLKGAINYPVQSYSLQCGSGNFIFFPPGLPHSEGQVSYIDTTKSTFCETLFFLLHPNAIQYWISRWETDRHHFIENGLILNQRIILLFQALMEEIYEAEEFLPIANEALLTAFFFQVMREINFDHIVFVTGDERSMAAADNVRKTTYSDFRSELERYIKININHPITIADAAQAMYFSRAQFTRTVRRETGMSFNELLSTYRLEEAKVLLHNSQWTIAFIAESLGFTSPDYFRTFFRKHTGKTPGEFRGEKSIHIPRT